MSPSNSRPYWLAAGRSGFLAALLVGAATLMTTPAHAAGGRSKLDRQLQAVVDAGGPPQRVIVQTAPGAGSDVAKAQGKKGRRADSVGT